ncbi:MAG: DUF2284 domain-containing protein [Eubacteriales bacterium]|nr:DUF2284 domain-containing protein [Eubacteriales bacterium]
MKDYRTEVIVNKIPVSKLTTYLDPVASNEACKMCTNYNNDWSCPPGQPDPYCYLKPYDEAYVICVKICYSDEIRKTMTTPEQMDWVRVNLFQKVQLHLQVALLELERLYPGSLSISTCLLCKRCARVDDLPCRHPESQRYSMTCLGFKFDTLLSDLFDMKLTWNDKGLPEYHVTVSCLLCNREE